MFTFFLFLKISQLNSAKFALPTINMTHNFFNLAAHRRLWVLALPILLSNITSPLLGLVDTAIIGHLPDASYLGGVALGATIISLTLFLFSFLRTATTGMVAQSFGANNRSKQLEILLQATGLALGFGIAMLALAPWLFEFALSLSKASLAIKEFALQYVQIRIWSLPLALLNLVFLGFLLGRQQPKVAMWQVIAANCANILFDIWFIYGLELGVKGAAYASVIADFIAFAIAIYMLKKQLTVAEINQHLASLKLKNILPLLKLKRDIFIRSLCLQLTFAFMTFQGANLSDITIAANAVLLNFLLLIAYVLDSIAYYSEAEGGKYWGANDLRSFRQSVQFAWLYSWLFGFAFSLIFYWAGEFFIQQLTDIVAVQQQATNYLAYLILLPLLACSAYLLDGVYIAAAKGEIMRNSMLFCTFAVFFPLWFCFKNSGNAALWMALCGFMIARSTSLAWHYFYRLTKTN